MAFADDTEDRPDFDPAVAEQLSTLTLSMARNNQQLNAAAARSTTAAPATVLTLGMQQNNAAHFKQSISMTPLEAATATNHAQTPTVVSGYNTAAGIPSSGQSATPPAAP